MHRLLPFSPRLQTTLILTQTNRIHPSLIRLFLFFLKKQTTPILIQTLRLLPFSHRLLSLWHIHTDYFNSHSDTLTTPILTKTSRLLSFSLRNPEFSHSHWNIQTTPHRIPPFSIGHTYYSDSDYSNSQLVTHTNVILTQTEISVGA